MDSLPSGVHRVPNSCKPGILEIGKESKIEDSEIRANYLVSVRFIEQAKTLHIDRLALKPHTCKSFYPENEFFAVFRTQNSELRILFNILHVL